MKPVTDQEAKDFLIALQKDLKEDREKETSQANPIYYGIQDIREEVTEDGYQDRNTYYDTESGNEITEEEIFTDYLSEDAIQELTDYLVIKKTDDGYEIEDMSEWTSYLEDNTSIQPVCIMRIPYIKPDTLFLTRKAAKKHLEANSHHYTKDAVTYAMTAWRSPQYEKLLYLLHHIDFEKSQIVMRDAQK